MSNILNLLSEETFAEKMDAQNRLLAAIASNTGGLEIKSWSDVQKIVRMGLASSVFSIGDQFVSEKFKAITVSKGGSTGITGATITDSTFLTKMGTVQSGVYEFVYTGSVWKYNGKTVTLSSYGISVTGTAVNGDEVIVTETSTILVWDIIGIDQDTPADSQFTHSITIQMHDIIDSMVFDATEALYYAESELSAGTYNFTLLAGYDPTYGGGKTYQFTLTQPVPAGGQIMFPWSYNTQASATKISTYSSRTSTTVIESVSVTEGNGGTALTVTNHTHKIRYGSNKWSESAIRQWLNSSSDTGAWWNPTNVYDRPTTQLASTTGFLKGLDNEFLSVVGNVKKRTALNTVTDGGGYEDLVEYMFLLSRGEVYAGNENNIDEGQPYPFYKNYSDLSTAGTGADKNRIKYKNGTATYWWNRSCSSGNGSHVRSVYPAGNIYGNSAYDSGGVAPACCII